MLYGKCVNQLVVVDAIYIRRTSPDVFYIYIVYMNVYINTLFSKSWVNVNLVFGIPAWSPLLI